MTNSIPFSFHARQSRNPWRTGEPSLGEIMHDPLIHLVMARDGLTTADVWPEMLRIRLALRIPQTQAA